MRFCVLELGRTNNAVGDHALAVIDDVAYTVARVSRKGHVGDTAELIATVPWAAIALLFPWLQEQKTGEMYRCYAWLHLFMEQYVPHLFCTVPAGLIVGIPPSQPSGDPQWTFYSAGSRVLTTEYVIATRVRNGKTHRVRYSRWSSRQLGDVHETGWYEWTNNNGRVEMREVPDTR